MGTMEGSHITLSHPQLGAIKGVVSLKGIHQFRSVPYATVPHRFGDPVVVESLGAEGVFDATKFGPISPQPANAFDIEFPSPKEMLPHDPLSEDELKCTNVSVTVPTGGHPAGGKGLPVMVWFHGGSFMYGAGSWPQYGIIDWR
jgi:carboxylesterase type B